MFEAQFGFPQHVFIHVEFSLIIFKFKINTFRFVLRFQSSKHWVHKDTVLNKTEPWPLEDTFKQNGSVFFVCVVLFFFFFISKRIRIYSVL